MEARIARLESDVSHMRADLADVKIDLRSLRDKMDVMNAKFDGKFDVLKDSVASLGDPIDLLPAAQRSFEPVSDEVFETLRSLYPYAPGALNPAGPVVVDRTLDWVKERVTIDTGYGEQMDVFLFVPTRGEPPFQAIVFFTGALPFHADVQRGSATGLPDRSVRLVEYLGPVQ